MREETIEEIESKERFRKAVKDCREGLSILKVRRYETDNVAQLGIYQRHTATELFININDRKFAFNYDGLAECTVVPIEMLLEHVNGLLAF